MEKSHIYRGYIFWQDGSFSTIKTHKEGDLWHDKMALEKHLRERLQALQQNVAIKDMVRGEIETIETEVISSAEGEDDDADDDETDDENGRSIDEASSST